MTWWFWGTGAWGMAVMMAVWVGLFFAVVWLLARVTRTEQAPKPEQASQVLDRRFAAGEITVEQYAVMKRALSGSLHPAE